MKIKFHVAALMTIFSFAGFGIQSAMAHHPEQFVYEAKNGTVTFEHAQHGERLECSQCHQQDPPEKIEVTKETAHGAVCKGCHQKTEGPTKCSECHVK